MQSNSIPHPNASNPTAGGQMMKRAILRLAERAGYRIIKNADRGRFDGQAAEIATLKQQLVQETTALKERLAQETTDRICAEAKISAQDQELERERAHLREAQCEIAEARIKSR